MQFPGRGADPTPQLHQCRVLNPLCGVWEQTCGPALQRRPPIPLHHSGNSVGRGRGGEQLLPQPCTYLCENEGRIKLEADVTVLDGLNGGRATAVHACITQSKDSMSQSPSVLCLDTGQSTKVALERQNCLCLIPDVVSMLSSATASQRPTHGIKRNLLEVLLPTKTWSHEKSIGQRHSCQAHYSSNHRQAQCVSAQPLA